MEYRENSLTYEDYIALRTSVDWNIFDEDQTRTCVSNSTYTITAVDKGKVIGMARMIGDGMYFLLLMLLSGRIINAKVLEVI